MKSHIGSVHRHSMSCHFRLPEFGANRAFLYLKLVDLSKLKFAMWHRAPLQTQDKHLMPLHFTLRRRICLRLLIRPTSPSLSTGGLLIPASSVRLFFNVVTMFTSFVAGSLCFWFFGLFVRVAAAAPTSTDYELQRRQSTVPSYVVQYGKETTPQCGGHNSRLLAATNVERAHPSIYPPLHITDSPSYNVI
jgi:hypothetical protein